MGLTKYPYGVSSFGIPLIGSGPVLTTGKVFFVHSGTGSDSNNGESPEQPFATIDYAIGRCTANKGDVIFCMPNHAETIASATTLVPDVDGISIIGLGNGSDMPELTFSATGSIIKISGTGTKFANIRFIAGVSAVVSAVEVNAHHVTFENCTWDFSTTEFDFLMMIDIDAFDYCTVNNCRFIAENATAGANQAIRLDDTHNTKITNCYFSGDYAVAVILGEGAAGTSLLIADNFLYNDDTGAASNGIDLNVAFTGMLVRNQLACLYSTNVTTLIDPGSCLSFDNRFCNAVDEYAMLTGPGSAST